MWDAEEVRTAKVSAALTASQAAKLERLCRETRRTRSQVVALLIERALVTDLGGRYQRQEATDDRH